METIFYLRELQKKYSLSCQAGTLYLHGLASLYSKARARLYGITNCLGDHINKEQNAEGQENTKVAEKGNKSVTWWCFMQLLCTRSMRTFTRKCEHKSIKDRFRMLLDLMWFVVITQTTKDIEYPKKDILLKDRLNFSHKLERGDDCWQILVVSTY